MDFNKKVGELLKEERKKGNLSLSDMGLKLKVSSSLIARWERGNTNITIDTIARFADALELEPEIKLHPKHKPKKK